MGQGSREKLHLQQQQQQQQQQQLSSPSAGPAGEVAAGGGAASGGTASGGAVRACPVQGGFAVVRPSAAVFQEMVEIVRRGDFKQSGWGGTTIGGWWGGATFQVFKTDHLPPVSDLPQSALLDLNRSKRLGN